MPDSPNTQACLPARIMAVLRCPACQGGELVEDGLGMICKSCGRSYGRQDGTPDLTSGRSLPHPGIYEDPHYLRWSNSRAGAQDVFYKEGGLLAYVQNAGHRAIKAMRGDDGQGLTLDLGCGDGAHYPYLPDPENSFGVDLDQASLSKLKARYPDYPALRGDAYNLPLKDGCIDCIVNVYNLEHMLFLDHALEEMGRVLAPGGRIFVSLPAEGGLAWGLGRRLSTARRFGDENLDYLRALEIDHINCIWQLDKALRRHFRIRRLRLFPLGVPSFHLNLVVTYCCTAG